jgi:hypothetical protein
MTNITDAKVEALEAVLDEPMSLYASKRHKLRAGLEAAEAVRVKARKMLMSWDDILGYSLETKHNAEVIATALREAEARGRASMKEDAAKAANDYKRAADHSHLESAAHMLKAVVKTIRALPSNQENSHD